jgi:hypothetical protein
MIMLKIKTFANQKPCSFFKALGHPMIAAKLEAFKDNTYPSIYDPEGHLSDFLNMTHLPEPSKVYVQAVEALTPETSLISEIQKDKVQKLLILSFEPEKHLSQMGTYCLFCEVVSRKIAYLMTC